MFGGTKPEKAAPALMGYEISHPFPEEEGSGKSSYGLTCLERESKKTSPEFSIDA
jgi:hypothetical protein